MSDDERAPDVEEEEEEVKEESPPPPAHHEPPEPKQEHEYRPEENEGKSEAELRMEMEMKKRRERENEEWREYEEMRAEERKKEEEEIQRLREKKERRKKEREAEERRMAELRAVEEQKRKAEEEERQRIKREAEAKKREEREMKKKAAQEEQNMIGKRNFVINKRNEGQQQCDDDMMNGGSSKAQQEMAKSKEQLENEKRAILEQRIQPLSIDGFNTQQLAEKAKEFYHHIYRLEGDKYDLEDRFKRQQYDLMELAERARQMNKGSGKQKVNVQAEPDPLSERVSGIPPKIVMYSQYERVKDRRTFTERRVVFHGSQYKELYTRIKPEKKVVMTDQGAEYAGDYEEPTPSERPVENGPAHEESGGGQDASAEVEIAAE